MATDLSSLETYEYHLVDARAEGLRKGHRVDVLDEELDRVHRLKASLVAGTTLLRKAGGLTANSGGILIDAAESRKIEREERDRVEHERRLAKRAGRAGDDLTKPQPDTFDLIKRILRAPPTILPSFAYGIQG